MSQSRKAKLSQEIDRRNRESLRVYRALPSVVDWHLSRAKINILQGGKRSGKTCAAFHHFGSLVTEQPLHGPDGEPLDIWRPRRPALFWLIGLNPAHIGQTVWPRLFGREEPFFVDGLVQNEDGSYRVYNPQKEDHIAPSNRRLPEPIIPERYYGSLDSFAWDDRKSRIFRELRLTNGNVIRAYPSSGMNPAAGQAVDFILIDEDILKPEHVREWEDRLGTKGGKLWWNAWPNDVNPNDALTRYIDLADKEEERGAKEPLATRTQIAFSKNPYVADTEKQIQLALMGNEEEIKSRDLGEVMRGNYLFYRYRHSINGIANPADYPEVRDDDLNQFWLENSKQFPEEWTRYFALDPGTARSAGVIGVIPEPGFLGGQYDSTVIVERELVVRKHDARQYAAMFRRLYPRNNIFTWIIDPRAGMQTAIGRSEKTKTYYSNCFAEQELTSCGPFGVRFADGSYNTTSRRIITRGMIEGSEVEPPRLRFVIENCPETLAEFRSYRTNARRILGEVVEYERPLNEGKYDCMQALEYLCSYRRLTYQKAKPASLVRKWLDDEDLYGASGRSRGYITL